MTCDWRTRAAASARRGGGGKNDRDQALERLARSSHMLHVVSLYARVYTDLFEPLVLVVISFPSRETCDAPRQAHVLTALGAVQREDRGMANRQSSNFLFGETHRMHIRKDQGRSTRFWRLSIGNGRTHQSTRHAWAASRPPGYSTWENYRGDDGSVLRADVTGWKSAPRAPLDWVDAWLV